MIGPRQAAQRQVCKRPADQTRPLPLRSPPAAYSLSSVPRCGCRAFASPARRCTTSSATCSAALSICRTADDRAAARDRAQPGGSARGHGADRAPLAPRTRRRACSTSPPHSAPSRAWPRSACANQISIAPPTSPLRTLSHRDPDHPPLHPRPPRGRVSRKATDSLTGKVNGNVTSRTKTAWQSSSARERQATNKGKAGSQPSAPTITLQ
jgi:hypothetical protein